jgi:hypothetical protein
MDIYGNHIFFYFFFNFRSWWAGRIQNSRQEYVDSYVLIFIFSLTNFHTFQDYFSCFGKFQDFSRSGSETCEIPNYSRISKLRMNPEKWATTNAGFTTFYEIFTQNIQLHDIFCVKPWMTNTLLFLHLPQQQRLFTWFTILVGHTLIILLAAVLTHSTSSNMSKGKSPKFYQQFLNWK